MGQAPDRSHPLTCSLNFVPSARLFKLHHTPIKHGQTKKAHSNSFEADQLRNVKKAGRFFHVADKHGAGDVIPLTRPRNSLGLGYGTMGWIERYVLRFLPVAPVRFWMCPPGSEPRSYHRGFNLLAHHGRKVIYHPRARAWRTDGIMAGQLTVRRLCFARLEWTTHPFRFFRD